MFAWLLRAKAKHTSPRATARGRSLTCREARRKKTLQKLNIHHKKKIVSGKVGRVCITSG